MGEHMIEVSVKGLFAPLLESGPDASKWDEQFEGLRNAHRELMARRGKDLGFYDLPSNETVVKSIESEVQRMRSIADDLLVLGIGGSSLGGQALVSALGQVGPKGSRVHFLDNVDPDTINRTLEDLDPARTVAAVITKSGGTVETLAQLLIVRGWFKQSLGQGESQNRMVFVTDPEKGFLRELSKSEGIRTFEIPENVGGRFSVLSPVGLLPAAFVGIDIAELLEGAAKMVDRVTRDDVAENPACLMAGAAMMAARDLGKSSLVMMPYSDSLRTMTSWFVQLWAESLGKRLNRHGETVFAGQTPIPAVGATDQHAQLQLFVEGPRDKVVTIIEVEQPQRALPIPDELDNIPELTFLKGRDLNDLLQAERRATRAALLDAGVPVLDIKLSKIDAGTVGGLIVLMEAACACAGILSGINPFDQPGVEAGKKMALGLLGREGFAEYAERVYLREELDIS